MEIDDIITSLSAPALIKDPIMRTGTFFHLPTGGYEMYTGGFSVVFPCLAEGKKWAFRCWYINNLGDVKDRYMRFSVDMRKSKLPYFCDFAFEDIGICVNGQLFPTTRMKWIEGQTIKDFMVQHKNEKVVLMNLANKFYKMCKDLHRFHFAHGDLQHGNILVGNDGNLYLVDYDSFYTPSLNGAKDIIHGIPDYQHPHRVDNAVENETLDYFSELIIYTSILGVAENPLLAEEYKIKDSERMLFSKDDFYDIQESKIFKDLMSLGGIFLVLLRILVKYLSYDSINYLQPFEDLLERNNNSLNKGTVNKRVIVNRAIEANGLHWFLISIDLQPTCTIFKWRVYSDDDWSYICNSGTEYITDINADKNYTILCGVGIGNSNNPTFLRKAGKVIEFSEYFPPLPQSTCIIDYHMGDNNTIYDIDLTHIISTSLVPGFANYPLQKGLSVKDIEELAKQQDTEAQVIIANMYYTGNILPKDYAMAVKWYRLAAEQGVSDAEYMLGNCYYYGDGVSQDYTQAVEWFRTAASHGNVEAESDLGNCYVNGYGVRQDYDIAKQWYRRAMSHGSETARENLQTLLNAIN